MLPAVALAANVCLWNYDSLDRWFDPAAGESVDCARNVRQALVAQGHAVTVARQNLPTDLSEYDVVFGLMGWYRCWSDNNTVGPTERAQLVSFLASGKAVYLEGCDVGHDNRFNELWPYFGAEYLDDGWPALTGNVRSLVGVPGTFAAGLSPDYLYQNPPDEYVDEFGAGTGTLLLQDQAGKGRVVFRQTADYRTLVSGVVTGAMQGPARDQLLAKYVDFLLHGDGVAERDASLDLTGFSANPNPVKSGCAVRFAIPPGRTASLAIFDAFGRNVRNAPAVDAGVRINLDLPAGTYFARLVTPAGARTLPLVVVR
jgi:hypothetical protein